MLTISLMWMWITNANLCYSWETIVQRQCCIANIWIWIKSLTVVHSMWIYVCVCVWVSLCVCLNDYYYHILFVINSIVPFKSPLYSQGLTKHRRGNMCVCVYVCMGDGGKKWKVTKKMYLYKTGSNRMQNSKQSKKLKLQTYCQR